MSHDVIIWPQMTFPGSHMQICTEVINSSLTEHCSERFEQIFEQYLNSIWGILVFPHLIIGIDVTLGHRYKKNPRYTSCRYRSLQE